MAIFSEYVFARSAEENMPWKSCGGNLPLYLPLNLFAKSGLFAREPFHDPVFRFCIAYFIYQFFSGEIIVEILKRNRCDVFQGFFCEESLMRGHNDIRLCKKQGQDVIGDPFVGVILEKEAGFFFIDVQAGAADLFQRKGIQKIDCINKSSA